MKRPDRPDSPFLLGANISLVPGMDLNDDDVLRLIANDTGNDPREQFKGMIAERLIRFGINGPNSVTLLHVITEAAARIARTQELPETLKDIDTLAALRGWVLQSRGAEQSTRALILGDRGLQYASKWGGRHIRRLMNEEEATNYCLAMARTGYSIASQRRGGESLGFLANNIEHAHQVLASFHPNNPAVIFVD